MIETGRPLKILTFTTLYPSEVRPRHGIFVETRLQHFRRFADAEVRVIAPVPWFPSGNPHFGRYSVYARTPREEVRDGIRVMHPRYVTAPGIGMYTQPFALALSAVSTLRAMRSEGFDFDLIDAHYLYPDGVAAAILARWFKRPFLVTARGSDVNVLPRYRLPRRMILRALGSAAAIVAVSTALKDELAAIGVDRSRVHVLRNGVDISMFQPVPPAAARAALRLGAGPVFASVGNLVPEKGHDLVIDAIVAIPEATLLIVGEGAELQRLQNLARIRGVEQRVQFLSTRAQRELTVVYSAADALVLGSTREGWPNVLLEAMACGTPVVARAVGGVPEIVSDPIAGIVVTQRSSPALADAMAQLLAHPRDRNAVRCYAGRFGWDDTSRTLATLLERILACDRVAEASRGTP